MANVRIEDLLRDYQTRKAELDRQGVYFLGSITDEEAERFSKTMLLMSIERQANRQAPITVYINSGGGSIGAGFAIIELMEKMRRDYGVVINGVVTGYAYSMGAVILQACDKRSMGEYSTLMVHSASWTLTGEDEKIFQDYEKLARHYRTLIGDLFARRTGVKDTRWWQRYVYSGRDKFLNAKECLELRLVDEVCQFGACIGPDEVEQVHVPKQVAP